ncbi:MAG: hypothetical protein O3C10_00690 [Chloroflexi bacterium]|nr:hypothetical protein [Chloroflexota bacterium]
MERHRNRLGWIWLVSSALIALGAIAGIFFFLFIASDGDKTAGELLFLAVGTLPGVVGGVGLLKRRNWARILVLIMGALAVMAFPIGTAMGGYTFWVLLRRETVELFA